MKLSELNTEQGLDVLCEITPYVAEIAADEELMREIKRKVALPEDAPRSAALMVGASKLGKIAPLVLKKNRNAVYGILSAINGISIDDLAKQNFLVTVKQIMDLMSDKEFVSFFKSYGKPEANV